MRCSSCSIAQSSRVTSSAAPSAVDAWLLRVRRRRTVARSCLRSAILVDYVSAGVRVSTSHKVPAVSDEGTCLNTKLLAGPLGGIDVANENSARITLFIREQRLCLPQRTLLVERLIEWGVDTIFGFPATGSTGSSKRCARVRTDPVHPGPPRGGGGVCRVRLRKVHRAAGRVPRHLGAGRHPPAQRPVRRQVRRPAGAGDHRPHLSRSDRHA